ncbi:MAG: DUF4203 domain-containing protein [Chloroflexi bacterium]|nr:DUF4203 domain-containing protein [Chloroflexota bacterium]
MPILRLLVGVSLLTLGRKLYWVFVAAIGFETGIQFTARFMHDAPEIAILSVAIVAGILGAVVAIFLRNVAIGVTGFLAGGFFLEYLAHSLLPGSEILGWVAFVVGGLIGAGLMYALFDWALIVLSSAGGASMIVQALGLAPGISFGIVLVLFIVGVIVQAVILQSEKT